MVVVIGRVEARMRVFSVAVTEASSKNILTGDLGGENLPVIVSVVRVNLAPKEERASRWVLMARLPMTSPPGKPKFTFPNLAMRGERNMMEERTLRLKAGLISQLLMPAGSITIVGECKPLTLAPKDSSISTIAATSRISGTLVNVTEPSAKMEAAKSFKISFLLPEMVMCPERGVPPVTKNCAMPGYYTREIQC